MPLSHRLVYSCSVFVSVTINWMKIFAKHIWFPFPADSTWIIFKSKYVHGEVGGTWKHDEWKSMKVQDVKWLWRVNENPIRVDKGRVLISNDSSPKPQLNFSPDKQQVCVNRPAATLIPPDHRVFHTITSRQPKGGILAFEAHIMMEADKSRSIT